MGPRNHPRNEQTATEAEILIIDATPIYLLRLELQKNQPVLDSVMWPNASTCP